MISERKSIHYPDNSKIPDQSGARQIGAQTTLGVPLLREGEFVGTLLLHRSKLRPFEDWEIALVERETRSHRRVAATAFTVIFIAEWGDLTQILTANLAAHYHSPLSVGIGAVAALWSVAALAVISGQRLIGRVPVRRLRQLTGVILLILAVIAANSTVRH